MPHINVDLGPIRQAGVVRSHRVVPTLRNVTPPAIPRYGLAGYADTAVGRSIGPLWLVVALLGTTLPELVGADAMAESAKVAAVVVGVMFGVFVTQRSRRHLSQRRLWTKDRQLHRAESIAGYSTVLAFFVMLALIATASADGEHYPLAAATAPRLAFVVVPIFVVAMASYVRLPSLVRELARIEVRDAESDTGLQIRRFMARGLDFAIVVGCSVAVLSLLWPAGAPIVGASGTAEFLVGLGVLLFYELVAALVPCTLGKLVFGVRVRRVPGACGKYMFVTRSLRALVLVLPGGLLILMVANLVDDSSFREISALMGAGLGLSVLSPFIHGQGQGLHDVAARTVVERR